MPGSIGVTAAEAARYSAFTASIAGLQVPAGTQIIWGLGMDVVANRNFCVREMLKRPEDEWLWFMDDDHVFAPNLLNRLLENDVDVVGCLYLKRSRPFDPTAYEWPDEETYNDVSAGRFIPLHLPDLPLDGLHRVWALGTAGMLIRRRVFERMEPPWFEPHHDGEDAGFCEKLRALDDTPIYVDLGARLGHMSATAIWPTVKQGRWVTGFTIADGLKLSQEIEP